MPCALTYMMLCTNTYFYLLQLIVCILPLCVCACVCIFVFPIRKALNKLHFQTVYLLTEAIPRNNVSLTLGDIYRSPSANKVESTRLLIDFIQKVCDKQSTYLLLVGDFNYSDINWETVI